MPEGRGVLPLFSLFPLSYPFPISPPPWGGGCRWGWNTPPFPDTPLKEGNFPSPLGGEDEGEGGEKNQPSHIESVAEKSVR